MPNSGDIAILRYGSDNLWHWAFYAVGASTALNFDVSGTTKISALPMSVMPVAKARIDVHPFSFTVGPTARRSGRLDMTVPAGLSAYFNVVAYQSAVPGANKGQLPDAREFDQILMTADITSDTTLRISWVATGPVIGNYNAYYQIKN